MGSIHSTGLSPGAAGREDHVQGTAIDFGEFRVIKYRRENQTILKFAGALGAELANEMERLAARCRGDVGIDLSELEAVAPKLVPALERVRRRMAAQKRALFLCNASEKLLDALTLAGVSDRYTLVGSPARSPQPPSRAAPAPPVPRSAAPPRRSTPPQRPGPAAARPGSEPAPPAEGPPSAGAGRREKEIAFFDHSLKRTEILERGLDSAARCVQKILPTSAPSVPGWGFAFVYRQSEKVGGDFFDFIPLERGCLGISIGDMSGRGLEAAILMCLAKKVISIRARDRAQKGPALPREVLSRANEDLRGDLERSDFITALYAVLDTTAGVLRFARAGHERPIWFAPAAGQEPRHLASEGTALGIVTGEKFHRRLQEYLVEMQPGSRVLFYTDGLIDAQGPRGGPFSRPRLLNALRRARPGQTAAQVLEALFEEIARHTGGGPPEDDMTALLIARD